ncbi:ATP-binding protein [candidate division KSB1 bacterium]|nr:ATP-binding protein [candidate division KSB1 bacterium]MBL7093179.1 ATP-binding protein [candidate division KSB1 bacterium]
MKKEKTKYKLKIPSKTDNLELIRSFVSNIAVKVGFDADETYKIELAVDEACANVVKHAYEQKHTDHQIDLVIELDVDKLVIIISDQGRGFDVKKILSKDMKEYLAEMRVGGLGIHLIKALMDDVEFISKPGASTQVKMTKYLMKNGKVEVVKKNE